VLRVVLVRGLCSCGGVRFDVLCINCYSFLNDIAVLLLLLKKVYIILVLANFRDVVCGPLLSLAHGFTPLAWWICYGGNSFLLL
jgi:hypothetical protein